MSKKSKKRVKAGKKAAVTRRYRRYLEDERQRRQTPYRYHAHRVFNWGRKTLGRATKTKIRW